MKLYDRLKSQNRYSHGLHPNELAKDSIEFIQEGDALEIGCGEGQDSVFLRQTGFNVTAADTSRASLENLIELAKIHCVDIHTSLFDVNNYKFSKKYDFILAEGSIHFVKDTELETTIRTLQEYTKPYGVHALGFYNQNTTENQKKKMLDWGIHTIDTKTLMAYYEDWEVLSVKEVIDQQSKYLKRGVSQIIVRKRK